MSNLPEHLRNPDIHPERFVTTSKSHRLDGDWSLIEGPSTIRVFPAMNTEIPDPEDHIDIDPDAVTPMWIGPDGRLTLTPQTRELTVAERNALDRAHLFGQPEPSESSMRAQIARGEAVVKAREFVFSLIAEIGDNNERETYLSDLMFDIAAKLEELQRG